MTTRTMTANQRGAMNQPQDERADGKWDVKRIGPVEIRLRRREEPPADLVRFRAAVLELRRAIIEAIEPALLPAVRVLDRLLRRLTQKRDDDVTPDDVRPTMTTGTIDNTVTIWVRRSFKERLFSLPWKPWCGWKIYEVTPASGSGVSVTVNPIVGPGSRMASEITFPPGTTIKKRLVREGWDRAS